MPERQPGLLGRRWGRLAEGGGHQAAGLLGGRVLLEHQRDVRDGLAGTVGRDEQLGEVEPERRVRGSRVDGPLQARDQVCVGHVGPPGRSPFDCDIPGKPRE